MPPRPAIRYRLRPGHVFTADIQQALNLSPDEAEAIAEGRSTLQPLIAVSLAHRIGRDLDAIAERFEIVATAGSSAGGAT